MTKLNHTLGPWEIWKNLHGNNTIISNEGYEEGYIVIATHVNAENARLIAAAPEMLERLIFEYDSMCQGCQFKKTCKVICEHKKSTGDIIEKATGLPIEEILKEE
jgi:hypothetical protein